MFKGNGVGLKSATIDEIRESRQYQEFMKTGDRLFVKYNEVRKKILDVWKEQAHLNTSELQRVGRIKGLDGGAYEERKTGPVLESVYFRLHSCGDPECCFCPHGYSWYVRKGFRKKVRLERGLTKGELKKHGKAVLWGKLSSQDQKLKVLFKTREKYIGPLDDFKRRAKLNMVSCQTITTLKGEREQALSFPGLKAGVSRAE